jgi:hypothetical protein
MRRPKWAWGSEGGVYFRARSVAPTQAAIAPWSAVHAVLVRHESRKQRS